MGMFDHVIVEVPLPDGWRPPNDALQTKDFDNAMVTMKISASGRLLEKNGSAWTDDADRIDLPQYRDLNFHGWMRFYGSDPRPEGARKIQNSRWLTEADEDCGPYVLHDYRAKFTDGQLMLIEMAEPWESSS